MRWLVALLILTGVAFAQSQQPPAKGYPPANNATQPPAPDQRGTDQVPITVKILPTPKPKPDADKEERERQDKAEVDKKLAFETQRVADYTDRLVLFTVFLFCVAVVQAALFVWQLFYMRAGVRDAKDAATAALLQANAIIAAERPYIFALPPANNEFLPTGAAAFYPEAPGNPLPKLGLTFANVGKLYGTMVECRAEIVFDNLPSEPIFSPSTPTPKGAIIVRPNTQTDTIIVEAVRKLTAKEAEEIGAGRKSFYCFGYIKYTDPFGWLHTKGFCFKMTFGKPTPELGGGTAFNYLRSERTPNEYAAY
jgi:hypothetical protein